ncbi:uncharacterized protein LOC136075745 [Hydra vulgaris]|uniref:Uncharacterized protein LOC136075745 n=1 Tax=Hydra vulgaris TaxID=6087 RepID=A0ABM4B8P8_HYDVU
MKAPKNLKGRPIIAGISSPTSHLSQFLHIILSPIVRKQISFIKDDWDFLRKIPRELESESRIMTCDIINLYTSIPHYLGLEALKFWINKYKHLIDKRFTPEFITESASFILNNNNFNFDKQLFHQITGTAMGTDFSPDHACLTIGFLEEANLFPIILPQYFSNHEVDDIKKFYFRYIDDGFIIWPKHLDIRKFEISLTELNDSIGFTIDFGKEFIKNDSTYIVITFLDITIMLENYNKIQTDIYYKETNTHDYLNYNSHLPFHIKKNIPYNLSKRIIVFTSNYEIEKLRLIKLKTWLKDCEYPDEIIEKHSIMQNYKDQHQKRNLQKYFL